MKLLGLWLALLTTMLVSCAAPTEAPSEKLDVVSSALVTMSTDATTYPKAGHVVVTFAGGPGAPRDWIGIAPVGAPDTQFIAYKYVSLVAGVTDGVLHFDLPAAANGNYEARLFYNDTYTRLGTSNSFHVGPLVSTDRASYGLSDSIVVDFAWVLPGNGLDWVAIMPVGGSAQSYVRWAYTGGVVSGSEQFAVGGAAPIAPGTYEARLYGYPDVLEATSAPFTVTGRTITTDKASYLGTESATVSFSGAIGSGKDWVAIIPEGAPDSGYVRWQYTNQQASGDLIFNLSGLAAGGYVAKLFANDNLTLQASSPSFTIAGNVYEVTADKASYTAAETAHVTFTSAPPTALDWIALAPVGSPGASYVRWGYTGATSTGTLDFSLSGLPSGSYEARLYTNNTLDLRATSASFTVTSFSVSTDKASYLAAETATVSFTAAPTTARDWIAIAPEGSPNSEYLRWAYTNGLPSGALPFALTGLTAGSYVARLYANDVYDLRAESAPFSVSTLGVTTTKSSYVQTEPVIVTFSGLPGNTFDWIAIAPPGAPTMGFVAWAYSYGEVNGTRSFTLAPGSYVARLHLDNGYAIAAESATFTVSGALQITTPSTLPNAILDGSYTQTLTVTGGSAPYSWSVSAGSSMPAGLSLSAAGVISGAPSVEGVQSFAVTVMDSGSQTAERTFSVDVRSIAPKPTLSSISPSSGTFLGPAITLSVTGTGFVPRSIVYWGNNSPLATTYISSTQLTAIIPSSQLNQVGPHDITVYTSLPGGGTSSAQTFTVILP